LTREHYAKEASEYYLENIAPATLTFYEFNVMKNRLIKMLTKIDNSKSVAIDIGCGTGIYTQILAKQSEIIVASIFLPKCYRQQGTKDYHTS
jgi:2-polyprenyl-3-methyl-5-hydroxy-6-metoxy-1,4-benzoquinol methylase